MSPAEPAHRPGEPPAGWPRGASRAARPADAAEVVRLAGLMYTAMGLAVTPQWAQAATVAVRSRPGPHCRIEVLDHPDQPGRLVACAAATVTTRLPSPLAHSARVGYLQWVCTEPDWRRLGCARAVTVSLLSWLESVSVSSVELHATADGAGLYRSLGFSGEGNPALRRRYPSAQPN